MRPFIIAAFLSVCLPLAAGAETLVTPNAAAPAGKAAPALKTPAPQPAGSKPAAATTALQKTVTPTLPSTGAKGPKLLEPHLHVARSGDARHPRVALTFDACMGKADERILSALVNERIPATIFVTARWLRSNPQTVAVLLQNPDLFDLENHGENHIPAVDVPVAIYGIAAAGSPEAVGREVGRGADAMLAAGIPAPRWFRGATAKYDASSIREIRAMGYRIAGYSLNGDDGSLLGAGAAEKRITGARDGDVVISHINQPTHAAGEGVARAIVALKAKGIEFVRLSDVDASGDAGTTAAVPPAL
jgi:peptidoglycan/xylan/chitin deacetylase (PgdA/CDA1 family)